MTRFSLKPSTIAHGIFSPESNILKVNAAKPSEIKFNREVTGTLPARKRIRAMTSKIAEIILAPIYLLN